MKYGLQLSGGRDSLALLKYWEPQREQSVVIWVNAGGTLPEVEALIRKHTQGWELHEVSSDSAAWIRDHGFPADIVPTFATKRSAALTGYDGQRVASSLLCCQRNIMQPLHQMTTALGVTHIVRGQRNAEDMKSPVRDGDVLNGITYLMPLQDWSNEDVNNYLLQHGVELPEWYQYGDKGFDCWWCTGFVKESKGLHKYLHLHHPEKFAVVEARLTALRQLINNAL